jgi:hypothetical protein
VLLWGGQSCIDIKDKINKLKKDMCPSLDFVGSNGKYCRSIQHTSKVPTYKTISSTSYSSKLNPCSSDESVNYSNLTCSKTIITNSIVLKNRYFSSSSLCNSGYSYRNNRCEKYINESYLSSSSCPSGYSNYRSICRKVETYLSSSTCPSGYSNYSSICRKPTSYLISAASYIPQYTTVRKDWSKGLTAGNGSTVPYTVGAPGSYSRYKFIKALYKDIFHRNVNIYAKGPLWWVNANTQWSRSTWITKFKSYASPRVWRMVASIKSGKLSEKKAVKMWYDGKIFSSDLYITYSRIRTGYTYKPASYGSSYIYINKNNVYATRNLYSSKINTYSTRRKLVTTTRLNPCKSGETPIYAGLYCRYSVSVPSSKIQTTSFSKSSVCSSGFSFLNNKCSKVTSITSFDKYVCPSGFSLSSNSCSKELLTLIK